MTGSVTISSTLERTAETDPERPALITPTETWSYGRLRDEVTRTANAFARLGIRAGSRVGIWLPNSPEWISGALAAIALRAVVVPINTRLRAAELSTLLERAPLQAILTTDSFLTIRFLDILDQVLPVESHARPTVLAVRGARPGALDYQHIRAKEPAAPSPQVQTGLADQQPDDPVSMFWTSGSTGAPKGVLTTHRVLGNVADYCAVMGLSEQDRCLVSSPLFYIAGFNWCLLAPISVGAAILPLSRFTADEILAGIETLRATVWIGIAHAHAMVINDPRFAGRDVTSLRAMYAGGAAMADRELAKIVRTAGLERFISVYGMTEAGGIATMTAPDDPLDLAARSIGFPLPGFQLRCVDPGTGRPVPTGRPGEIWLRSPYLSPGYLSDDGGVGPLDLVDGWFRTGDLGRIDETGRVWFVGRIKDIIKVNGENVAPAEVEQALLAHPGVHAACVVALSDTVRGEVVGAAVIAGRRGVDADDLVTHCRAMLAPFKVPRVLRIVREFPTTPAGKPAKREIADMLLRAAGG